MILCNLLLESPGFGRNWRVLGWNPKCIQAYPLP